MRPFFLLILCFLFFAFSGDKQKNDLHTWNLKGKVKSVSEYIYWEKVIKPGINLDDLARSSNSFKVKRDSIKSEVFLQFNKAGNETSYLDTVLLEHTFKDSIENNSRIGIHRNTICNDSGEPTVTISGVKFHGKDYKIILTKMYDSKGNIVSERDSTLNDNTIIVYSYFADGEKVKYVKHDFSGHFIGKGATQYNKDGFIVSSKSRENNYGLKSWSKTGATYIYDKDRVVKITGWQKASYHKGMWSTTFNYDEKGNIVSDNGVIRDALMYPHKGEYKTDRYFDKFQNLDANGNWLRKVEIRNDTLMTVTERSIEYYP